MYEFQGDTNNIILKGKGVIEVGNRYTITYLTEDDDCNEIIETVTGEYRGLSEDEGYIIFWIDGDSKGRDIYLRDITELKSAQ